MKIIQATAFSLDSIAPATATKPAPGTGEILVKVSAATLNYRDLAVLSGGYLPNLPMPFVPASDCCGTVEAVGAGVTRFKAGDRVVPCYIQGYRDGALTAEQRANNTLGGPLPGVLQEYRVVPAEDAIAAPAYMSDAEAATLPIAALTAWPALQRGGLKAGDNVLVQGTGGVVLFALQFARAAGARAGLEAMCRAMTLHEIHPVLDRTFAFNDARAALQHMQRAAHVGKIVIDVAGRG